jgi:hypothetical protein
MHPTVLLLVCSSCLACADLVLQDNFLASFLLGWGITIGAGLASYPIDTVRRRMMMTSGQAVKYKSSIDCFQQVGIQLACLACTV